MLWESVIVNVHHCLRELLCNHERGVERRRLLSGSPRKQRNLDLIHVFLSQRRLQALEDEEVTALHRARAKQLDHVLVRHAEEQLRLHLKVSSDYRVAQVLLLEQLHRDRVVVQLGQVHSAVRTFGHVTHFLEVRPWDRDCALLCRRGACTGQPFEVEVRWLALQTEHPRALVGEPDVLALIKFAARGQVDEAGGGVALRAVHRLLLTRGRVRHSLW
mmetsp:Transcript_12810/g.30517  ORF Transcript_12810/g.30517 Transcript_12810/m.30517 type:complete len:217 (-) Transcript_12810:13-663(-)